MKPFLKILAGITIVLLVLWLAFDLIAPSIIKDKIEKGIENHPADSVNISKLDIHYFPLGISLNNSFFLIHQTSNSNMYQWEGNLHQAKAGGVKWIKAWQDDVWDINNLEFTDGDILRTTVNVDSSLQKPKKDTASSKPIELLFRNLSFNNFNVKLNRPASTIKFAFSANLDSLSIKKADSLQWQVKYVKLNSTKAALQNVMTDYDMAYQNLHYDSDGGLLTVRGFKLDPRLTKEEFARRYPKRKVQPTMKIPLIRLSGIQLDKLNQGLFAHKLLIDSADVEIHQDLNKERPDKFKPMPSELIAKIPFPVAMDSLQVKNASLVYTHDWKTDKYGEAILEGDKIELSFYPINNIGHPVAADVKIKGNLRFYKESVLSMNVTCFADKPNHDFEVNAHLSPTSFALYNPVLHPSSGIKFESGYCDELKAYFYGDDYSTKGDINMSYKNLKIEIPNDGGLKGMLAEIGELAGNAALINEDNSMDSSNGKIDYERNTNQPFVNYWWKSLQNGLMDVMITVK